MKSPRDWLPPNPVADSSWLPLSRGAFALIDAEDLAKVSPWSWTLFTRKQSRTAYALRQEMGRTIYLHRFIMGVSIGLDVDHVDGNGLNCKKSNLRVCSHADNQKNYTKTRRPCTSQFKGVYFAKERGQWLSRIKYEGKVYCLGRFYSEEAAARAYDSAAIKYFGQYARLNYPVDDSGSRARMLFRQGLAWT